MPWVAVATVLLIVAAVAVAAFFKRHPDANPMGTVSSHWVSEHRIDE